MFKFRFIMDYFQIPDARGPVIEASMRAKWLSRLCPKDIDLAFSPNPNQKPLYDADRVKLVSREEPGWWNHYFFNYWDLANAGEYYSLGPNIRTEKNWIKPVPLVVYSQFHKELLLKGWPHYPKDLIKIIPNMVDPEIFYPGSKAKELTVGWIGNDAPDPSTKGAEVIPYLAKAFPDVHFVMIFGNKPDYALKWIPDSLENIEVKYQVPHHQIADIIRTWSAYVSGSKWETGATHVKEVMACEIPVIAPNRSVFPEIARSQMLLDGVSWKPSGDDPDCLVWTDESLDQYKQALQEFIQHPKKRRRLSKAARKESAKAFPDKIAKEWFDFMYQCKGVKENGIN
ncbi:group 1 glycosyl transferase [Gracilibacillus halophilus YIM-C55.5]|uniref:Group 1 glycosyl transferase n=1 Tax=Gracilibacillus halophilus YIM-C55.5 TaxID=1308866 RepID=N4WKD8_9BACI|nr:glycosyltransferase family 4 protein [Gracilibacillus halophilus]ENH96607.1 group 1 glycosyl transferase [Gracilibacillus halophilus YIM-C55.5]